MEFIPVANKDDTLTIKWVWKPSNEAVCRALLKRLDQDEESTRILTNKFLNLEDDATEVIITFAEYRMLHKTRVQDKNGKTKESYWLPDEIVGFLNKYRIDSTITEEKVRALIGKEIWDDFLNPYQREGIIYILKRHGRGMIGDDMGLGKTIQCLLIAWYFLKLASQQNKEPPKILILCPSIATKVWKKEWETKLKQPEHQFAVIPDSDDKTLNELMSNSKILAYSCSIDLLQHRNTLEFLLKKKFKTIIIDECHSIRSHTATRTKMALKLIKNADHCILSSGTLMDKAAHMWAMTKACQPDLFPLWFQKDQSVFSYAWRYCDPQKVKFGRPGAWEFKGSKRQEELFGILRHTMLIRRNAVQAKQKIDLPPLTRQYAEIYLKQEIKIKLKELSNTVKDKDMKETNEPFMDVCRKTALAKLPELLKEAIEFVEKGEFSKDPTLKWLIFGFNKDVLQVFCELFEHKKLGYIYIAGDTPKKKRFQAMEKFQSDAKDSPRIAVLNWVAAGTAISLTKANHVWFVQLPLSPGLSLQAEKRAHRPPQDKPVFIKYFTAPGTMDDRLKGLLRLKAVNAAKTLDGGAEHSLFVFERGGKKRVRDSNEDESEDEDEKEEDKEKETVKPKGTFVKMSRATPAAKKRQKKERPIKNPFIKMIKKTIVG